MQLHFDNLIANLMAGTILLILVGVTHRSQIELAEATNIQSLQVAQMEFTSTLRRDMMGITQVVDKAEDPADTTFTFYARVGQDSSEVRIIYKRTRVGERNGVDLYQIRRYVGSNAPPGDDYNGASMPTMTAWSIDGQNYAGNEPNSAASVRQVHVKFKTVPPFTEWGGKKMKQRLWEATFRPPQLRENKSL